MADLIYYMSDDVTGQGQAVMAVARLKYPDATIVDNAGDDEAAIDAIIAALAADTYDNIVLCQAICDSHVAGRWLGTQAVDLVPKLVTANQTSGVANPADTCGANAEVLNIKLAAGDTGANDAYNQMIIETAGDVVVARLITDYVSSTKICTVATTSSAVDASETYVIFNTPYLRLLGESHSSRLPAVLAWNNLFTTDDQVPLVIAYLGGGDNLFVKNNKTSTAVAAGTLSDTTEFVAGAYDGKEYYVAIISSAVDREAGQIRKIISNTVTILTLEENWDTTPTHPVQYQIVDRNTRTLWNIYLKYAVAAYLSGNDDAGVDLWEELIVTQDDEKIAELVEKGKYMAEAVFAGILS